MILRKDELEELVESKHVGPYFVPLQIETFKNYKSNLSIGETGFNRDVETEATYHRERYQLRAGSYLVEFREEMSLPDSHIAMIVPSSNSLAVGGVAHPRVVTDDELWTLFSVSKSVDVDDDAVVALLLVYHNLVEERLLSKVNRLSKELDVLKPEEADAS